MVAKQDWQTIDLQKMCIDYPQKSQWQQVLFTIREQTIKCVTDCIMY